MGVLSRRRAAGLPGTESAVRNLRCALVATAVVVLSATGSASAQYFGQNKVQYRQYEWRSIRSDHFEVYFYPELDSLALRVLDLAEKADAMLVGRLGHRLTRRVPIVLYGSHNDFAQTNVTPELIDAGTGGFTEVLRNRVVLPFTGSYEGLRHVLVHELVHAYMFDALYGGAAGAMLARQSFFSAPLWFAEGLAEHISLGMEPNAEMFLRDGSLSGYLAPLPLAGGYLVYKQGQSAIEFLVERFGEERLRQLLQNMRQMRSFERAFQRSFGTSVERFEEQWRTWMRKRYWPTVATKEDPEQFARRLTDHRRDHGRLNTAPAVSPQGDRVAYISDRRQFTDVYIMSAFDGKVLKRLIRGEYSVRFESIPSFRSSLAWSPDGRQLALVAQSGGRDVLYVVEAASGRVAKKLSLECASLAYPAWSPVSDSIVVAGVRGDRSDLWLVDAGTGHVRRLTDDAYDEKDPSWAPDGRSITFASDRLAPVVLHPLRQQRGYGAYAIFRLDLERGHVDQVLDTHGDDSSPAWSPDGSKMAFISDRDGTPNILLYDVADSTLTQLTDVQGGVISLSWSREGDRLVFAAYNRGGFDIFAVRDALSLDSVVERIRRRAPQAVMSLDRAGVAVPGKPAPASRGALAADWPDTVTAPADTVSAPVELGPAPPRWAADTLSMTGPAGDRPWAVRAPQPAWTVGDSIAPLPTTSPLRDEGGAFAVADSVLAQEPKPYRARLSPEYAGAGFYASTVGVVGTSQFVFSDFLGNHSLFLATDLFINQLSETNGLVVYNYLPRRWDVGAGLFHFKNYFASDITTLGEQLGRPRLFAERNFGLLASASYPFDRFRRVELGFIQMFVDRTFFSEDAVGVSESGREFRSVSSPSLSLVGDNARFGVYGPVNGRRYNLTFSPSFAWFPEGLAYRTVTLDARRYASFGRGTSLAVRVLTGVSGGRDPQSFQVGGFSTLRGLPDFETHGSRIAIGNLEMRFPFIQQLGVVGPVPLGVFNLRGVAFVDAGLAWEQGERPRVSRTTGGTRRLEDLMLSYGTGVRTALGFVILKLDVAWRTDLADTRKPRWHFSVGPEF